MRSALVFVGLFLSSLACASLSRNRNLFEMNRINSFGQCGDDGEKCAPDFCCSKYGFCGLGGAFCGDGCQEDYGKCDPKRDSSLLKLKRLSGSTQLITECRHAGDFALTIDDGPGAFTPRVLDILKAKHVKATFFMLMDQLQKENFAKHSQRAMSEGHQLGFHDWDHTSYLDLSEKDIYERFGKSERLMLEKIGAIPRYFRFPYGLANEQIRAQIAGLGYRMVQWNLDTRDWESLNGEAILQVVSNEIGGKSDTNSYIALIHDIHETTVDALEDLIDSVLDEGYRFVTMRECIGERRSAYFETLRNL